MTEQLAARLEDEARQRSTGLIDPVQERFADQKRAPVNDHLDAFERNLRKNSPKHVSLPMSRVKKIVEEASFEALGDFSAEAVENVLSEMLADEEIGHRTYNHYIQAIDSFCNWCVSTKRLIANPLVSLERLNADVDVRHKRRALSPEEVAELVQSARESGEDIQCFSGEQRARIYTVSYMTGLRRKEIASLTPRSFSLDSSPPTVTIEAACSKSRRTDVLPLHPDLVRMVRGWIKGMRPDAPLFPKLANRRTWLMVKKDLERVGIDYETPDGIADFHAAGRHSHITGLVRSGASIPEAQKLARHTDVKLTMRYTHIGIADQARAVSGLPALQMRCISRGSEGQSVSSGVSERAAQKHRKPGKSRASGVDRRQVAVPDLMEAAGIE